MLKHINGATFRKMILAGASLLERNKKIVDGLNVFPVPDGDTGTNMCLTLKSAVNEVTACPNNSMAALGEALSKGALRGARGNSGVILSQIMKGIASVVIEANADINTKQFARAMSEGAKIAYKAVTKPKEGTILTVIRIMAEASIGIAKKVSDFEEFFKLVLDEGEKILQQTPEMLPVLKKAGVVDAGGRGLLVIFNGFYKVAIGDENLNYEVTDAAASISEDIDENEIPDNFAELADLNDLGDIEFAYCTELMIINMHKKTTNSDIDKLRDRLMSLGDSVICIGDLSLVKIHVHTNEPNKVLSFSLELGELFNLKIENMLEQFRTMKAGRESQAPRETKPFAMVAVAPGKGLAAIFKDLTVDAIIEGGQTMNPSANDIAVACDKVPSNNVFVFPNNKNIILAAEQAQNLTSKKLYIVPTTSIPEGISAILAQNPEGAADENFEAMKESIQNVKSGAVTYAVRDTNTDEVGKIKEGDIIGLNEKRILAKGKDVEETTIALIDKMMDDNVVNITLFYGSEIKKERVDTFEKLLQKQYPNHEVSLIEGGQPVYYFIVSLE